MTSFKSIIFGATMLFASSISFAGEKVVSLDELQNILNRVAEHFPGGTVIIRGDREANLGMALAILDCCKIADISSVSFATIPPEESEAD